MLHLCTVAPCCHARDGLCRAAECQRNMMSGTAQTFTGQKCFVGGQECQDMGRKSEADQRITE